MEEIVAPDFGESVFEASVGKWFKIAGEPVSVGEPIVELHTDKAVQEINAVRSGVIGTILKDVDDVVRPGDALCQFNSESEAPIANVDVTVGARTDDDVPSTEETGPPTASVSTEEVIERNGIEEEDDGYVDIQLSPFVETPPTSISRIRDRRGHRSRSRGSGGGR